MQRVHVPQWSRDGGSGARSRVVRISAEEKPRPQPPVDLHGALAVPPEAGVAREVPLEHRAGVDIDFLPPAKARRSPSRAGAVSPPSSRGSRRPMRTGRSAPAPPPAAAPERRPTLRGRLEVTQRDDHHRAARPQDQRRVGAALDVAGHPGHVAMASFGHPAVRTRRRGSRGGSRRSGSRRNRSRPPRRARAPGLPPAIGPPLLRSVVVIGRGKNGARFRKCHRRSPRVRAPLFRW